MFRCGAEAPEDYRQEDHCRCANCIDFRSPQEKVKAEQSKHASHFSKG